MAVHAFHNEANHMDGYVVYSTKESGWLQVPQWWGHVTSRLLPTLARVSKGLNNGLRSPCCAFCLGRVISTPIIPTHMPATHLKPCSASLEFQRSQLTSFPEQASYLLYKPPTAGCFWLQIRGGREVV